MAQSVYAEIQKRAQGLQARDPGLTTEEAERRVLNADVTLYRRYVQGEASTVPAPPPRQAPRGSAAEVEAYRRASSLMAKDAALSEDEAIAKVFREDQSLYGAYTRKAEAPTFGAELLGRELDLYGYYSALQSTMQGILASDASDKGARLVGALDAFKGAVLAQVQQAGIAVPAEKRASDVIPEATQREIIRTAAALAPGDYQQGMSYVASALEEIRGWGKSA